MLLADEPTGNLDKANGENVVEILQQLAHEQDYCIIIVTHDPDIAERCDRVWRMSDGLLKEEEMVERRFSIYQIIYWLADWQIEL